MNELVVMCGIPRSGKSTWVNENLKGYHIVCADDIRLALGVQFDFRLENFVWGVHDTAVRAALVRERDVVIDATNTTITTIKRYAAMAEEYSINFRVVHVNTPLTVCFARNKPEIPGSVPNKVIDRMARQLDDMMLSGALKGLKVDTVMGS